MKLTVMLFIIGTMSSGKWVKPVRIKETEKNNLDEANREMKET